MTSPLTTETYETIIHCATNITASIPHVRQQTLYLLHETFHETNVLFWRINEDHQPYDALSTPTIDPLITNTYKQQNTNHDSLRQHYPHQVTLPITHNQELIGILQLFRKNNHPFTNTEIQQYTTLTKLIAPCLPHCIDTNMENQLTPREKEIVQLVKRGYSNELISKELYISIHTVKKHLSSIFQKYNVPNRVHLLKR